MGWLSCIQMYFLFLVFIHSQLLYRSSVSTSLSPSAIAGPKSHSEECTALLHFLTSLTINTSLTCSGDTCESCCELAGVSCDEATGHVISLNFYRRGLRGSIASNSSLFLLRHLEELDLSYNDFRASSVVPEFGQFKNMTKLSLSYSNFSGYVPLEISHLSRLVHFELREMSTQGGSNALYMEAETFKGIAQNLTNLRTLQVMGVDMSSVPSMSLTNLTSSITSVDLSLCKLRGQVPEHIFRLPNLQVLSFYGNNLTGSLPKSNWSSPLDTLDLSYNSLSGQIPRSLFSQEQLTSLDLSFNNFVGRIPDFRSNATQDFSSGTLPLKLNYLSLSNNFLNGTIPPWIFALPSLTHLDLSKNFIAGEIGRISLREAGKESLNYLNLSYNFLTKVESLPRENLLFLDLRSNLISGPLPTSLPPFLRVFLASKNRLEGEIPAAVCNMTFLEILDFSYNNLSGTIPPCMENLSYLSVLDLRKNKFHGTIPATCANIANSLRNLNLNSNQLEGTLPRSLINCRSLEVLDLGNNMLSDTFPHWLETLPNLRVLVLRSNRFYGSIENPKTMFPFHELRIIDVSYNKFGGTLPIKYFENFKAMMSGENDKMGYMGDDLYRDSVRITIKGFHIELVKIQTILTTIDFSSNKFTGQIPELIGRLKSLEGLNFSHNMLRGTIPPTLGNLTNLEWLDFSSNELVGKIPTQLADITSLAFLNLSHNQLEGPIPRGNQFNTFDNNSYSGNLGLCGFPPAKTCHNNDNNVEQSSPPMSVEEEDDSGKTKVFDWKIVLMGYGCGVVIGMSMGYILLYSDGKLSWLCEGIVGKLQHARVRSSKKRNARLAS